MSLELETEALARQALGEAEERRKAKLLSALSRAIRLQVFDILHEKQTGHWGGSASACDVATALYFHRMRLDPGMPDWGERDRFVLSKGHASIMLYAVLAHRGFFPVSLLRSFRDLDSSLQGHPCMNKTPGVDMSTGALGHGLSVGLGMAMAAALNKKDYQTYVMVGEGCLDEGQSWEALMGAGKFKPRGLTLLVDNNDVQLDGTSGEIMPLEPLGDKLRAFGWKLLPKAYDGHDMGDILRSFEDLDKTEGWPKAVVYKTVKGKGVSFMEGKNAWHGAPIDKGSYGSGRPELEAALQQALAEVR